MQMSVTSVTLDYLHTVHCMHSRALHVILPSEQNIINVIRKVSSHSNSNLSFAQCDLQYK